MTIDKELIPSLNFLNIEHLINHFQRQERDYNLYLGMLLGNCFKQKVKICIGTTEGEREVETTIWAKTDRSILLKAGVEIPVSAIREVRLY